LDVVLGKGMLLIQIFLPLTDSKGTPFPRKEYEMVERDLTSKFNGFTAYPRAPATGIWKSTGDEVQRDELVIYEVVAKTLDRSWWQEFRLLLEDRLHQEKMLIRSQEVRIL
jgi:hypothetical protein